MRRLWNCVNMCLGYGAHSGSLFFFISAHIFTEPWLNQIIPQKLCWLCFEVHSSVRSMVTLKPLSNWAANYRKCFWKQWMLRSCQSWSWSVLGHKCSPDVRLYFPCHMFALISSIRVAVSLKSFRYLSLFGTHFLLFNGKWNLGIMNTPIQQC